MSTDVDIYDRLAELALPAEERNSPVVWDDIVTAETIAETPNPYRVVNNKDELIGVPIYVREVLFRDPRKSDYSQPYAVLYCVTQMEMVVIVDGGTGIYRQIRDAVQKRMDSGVAEPTQGFLYPNGLRKSEYAIDKQGRAIDKGDRETESAGKGVTHYFA